MLAYYFKLAFNSLRKNLALSCLTIATIAIGIGASMSTYTIYHVMSGDPIPWKSSELFVPQIDSLGPTVRSKSGEPSDLLSYQDAIALQNARPALHQAAMYQIQLTVAPADPNQLPFAVSARASGAGFFSMFDTPFALGTYWSKADEQQRANVAVLAAGLADRLFHGENPLGKAITLNQRDYRIVGVLKPWNPSPRFYDLSGDALAQSDAVYIPFTTAIDHQMASIGHKFCAIMPDPAQGWQGLLSSNCAWLQYWVELPTAGDADNYRQFLQQYATDQQRAGRFGWPALTRLRNVREWLIYKHVIPDEIRAVMAVGFSFLLVCLINAIGLMLAKFNGRTSDLGVRRALGASKRDVVVQCLAESALVGLLSGVAGLALTLLAVAAERNVVSESLAKVIHVDLVLVLITLLLAEIATICAGLYPAWRASRIQPALQLKM
ncbi:ABC transporter permease [Dyella flagellata]|uniref:ABC transporter ATP-binding protein n=1 Tax=Dyella flagellata TaxID=1867833 RepID=A0ABQ5X912_9GAMM|nr:ABC transporter permease [Dyella flagellata]GLQ87729.1 ABC transporter ATP-binding protein [Dyella flagellata]